MNTVRDSHSNAALPAISGFVLAYSYMYSCNNNLGFLNNTQNAYHPGSNDIVNAFNTGTNGSIHQNKTLSFPASLPNSFSVTGVTNNNQYYTFDGIRFSINGNEQGITSVPTQAVLNFKTLSATPFVHHIAYNFMVSNVGSQTLSFAYSYNGTNGNSSSSINSFLVPANSTITIQPIVQSGFTLSYFYRNDPTTIYSYVSNQSIIAQPNLNGLKVDYNQVNAQPENQVFVSYKNALNGDDTNLQFTYRFPIDGGGYDGQSNVMLSDETTINVNDSQSVQLYDISYNYYGHSEYVLSYDIFIPNNNTNLSGIYDNSMPIDINQNCFNNGRATISFTLTPQSSISSIYVKEIILRNNNPYNLPITLQIALAETNAQQNIYTFVNIYKDAQLSNQLLYDECITIDANSSASYWFVFDTSNEYYDLTLTNFEHSTTDEIDESIIHDFAVESCVVTNISCTPQESINENTFEFIISSNDMQIGAPFIDININTVFDHASHTKKLLHFYVPRSPYDNSILCKTNGIDPISYIRYSIVDANPHHSNVVKRLVADKYDVVTSRNDEFNDSCVLRLSYYDVFQNSNEYDSTYILSYWKIGQAHTTDMTPDLEDVRVCMTFPISKNSNYSDLEISVMSIHDRIDSTDILDVYSYVKPLGSRIDYNFALNNIDSDVYAHIRNQIAEMPIKIYDISFYNEYDIDGAHGALYDALYNGCIDARISTNTSLQKTISDDDEMWCGKPILLNESYNLIVSFPSFNQEGLGLSTQIIRDIHIDSEHYDVVEVSLDNLDNIVENNDQNTSIRNDIASGNKVYKFSPINATSSNLLEYEPDTIVSFDNLLSIQHSISISDTYYALTTIFYSIDEVYTNISNSNDNRFVVNNIKSNNIYSSGSNIAFNISQMFDKGYALASVHACEIDNGNYNESSGLSYTYLSSPFEFNVANCSQNAHLCLFMEFSYANGISKFIDENPKNNIPDIIETNNSYVEPEYKVYVQFGNSNELELSWKPKVEI